jgi:hypothetical protein
MNKAARTLGYTIALSVAVLTLALTFQYHVRLRLLEHRTVVIQPGKWVWVECQTQAFSATIEEVTAFGIVVSVAAPPPEGLPCTVTNIAARGERRYFMPFRTLLEVRVGEQEKWSNPFPI